MDRTLLFYGSLAVYGAAFAAGGIETVLTAGITAPVAFTVASGVVVFVSGVYGLSRPDATNQVTDSWMAYLMVVGALLLVASLVIDLL